MSGERNGKKVIRCVVSSLLSRAFECVRLVEFEGLFLLAYFSRFRKMTREIVSAECKQP